MELRCSKRTGLIALPLAATLFTSCGATKLSPGPLTDADSAEVGVDAGSVADGYGPDHSPPFLPLRTCGGTVQGVGTSPGGEFSAASVYVAVHCGSIFVDIYDARGLSRVELEIWAPQTGALGPTPVAIFFVGPPKGAPFSTTGTVEITALTDPRPPEDAGVSPANGDAMPWGMLEGSFVLTSDGLSITGSFASPYCQFSNVHCTI